ncbi:MAG: hypothetical protein OXH96_05815 [Spirochaetaceae bacterium]|nr:hypothetical protein [Spirochaetaceae bacterium]
MTTRQSFSSAISFPPIKPSQLRDIRQVLGPARRALQPQQDFQPHDPYRHSGRHLLDQRRRVLGSEVERFRGEQVDRRLAVPVAVEAQLRPVDFANHRGIQLHPDAEAMGAHEVVHEPAHLGPVDQSPPQREQQYAERAERSNAFDCGDR